MGPARQGTRGWWTIEPVMACEPRLPGAEFWLPDHGHRLPAVQRPPMTVEPNAASPERMAEEVPDSSQAGPIRPLQ